MMLSLHLSWCCDCASTESYTDTMGLRDPLDGYLRNARRDHAFNEWNIYILLENTVVVSKRFGESLMTASMPSILTLCAHGYCIMLRLCDHISGVKWGATRKRKTCNFIWETLVVISDCGIAWLSMSRWNFRSLILRHDHGVLVKDKSWSLTNCSSEHSQNCYASTKNEFIIIVLSWLVDIRLHPRQVLLIESRALWFTASLKTRIELTRRNTCDEIPDSLHSNYDWHCGDMSVNMFSQRALQTSMRRRKWYLSSSAIRKIANWVLQLLPSNLRTPLSGRSHQLL